MFHMKPTQTHTFSVKQNLPTRHTEALLSHRTPQPKIIDYEGSSYKTDFWEGQGREFEDLTERKALRRLLPKNGETIVEIGAGFGRLADLYSHYQRVILVDYSISLLTEAKQTHGNHPNYQFIAANVYNLPFAEAIADTAVMIRVAHHLESIDLALKEVNRILQNKGVFIFEFANKRNAKAIARYLFRRQNWNPFTPDPYEFIPLNFDFHPQWMKQQLQRAGFNTDKSLAISNFRFRPVKRYIPAKTLANIDNFIAVPGSTLNLSPSILTKNSIINGSKKASADVFFICPKCKSGNLSRNNDEYYCNSCQSHWPIKNGIIDFRYPRPTTT